MTTILVLLGLFIMGAIFLMLLPYLIVLACGVAFLALLAFLVGLLS